jgi:hypothetical protein
MASDGMRTVAYFLIAQSGTRLNRNKVSDGVVA